MTGKVREKGMAGRVGLVFKIIVKLLIPAEAPTGRDLGRNEKLYGSSYPDVQFLQLLFAYCGRCLIH